MFVSQTNQQQASDTLDVCCSSPSVCVCVCVCVCIDCVYPLLWLVFVFDQQQQLYFGSTYTAVTQPCTQLHLAFDEFSYLFILYILHILLTSAEGCSILAHACALVTPRRNVHLCQLSLSSKKFVSAFLFKKWCRVIIVWCCVVCASQHSDRLQFTFALRFSVTTTVCLDHIVSKTFAYGSCMCVCVCVLLHSATSH